MNKKYTLQEAFKKRLLYYGERVDLERLYTPYRSILTEGVNEIPEEHTLYSCFRDNGRFLTGFISKDKEGNIVVKTHFSPSSAARLLDGDVIVSKLLSNEAYNIRAIYTGSYRTFQIFLPSDILVSFEGDEEFPVLELPATQAYVLPTE